VARCAWASKAMNNCFHNSALLSKRTTTRLGSGPHLCGWGGNRPDCHAGFHLHPWQVPHRQEVFGPHRISRLGVAATMPLYGTTYHMTVRLLQDHPALLVGCWRLMERLLKRLAEPIERWGVERASGVVRVVERPVKRLVFSCEMCGQCVLHRTGMTCPMTCPKEIRNGPCGGVALDGSCEVDPQMPCVWVQAIERADKTPWRDEIYRLNPAVDWRLEQMASWVTFASGRDQWVRSLPGRANEAGRAPEERGPR
jgi:hypothetical protein